MRILSFCNSSWGLKVWFAWRRLLVADEKTGETEQLTKRNKTTNDMTWDILLTQLESTLLENSASTLVYTGALFFYDQYNFHSSHLPSHYNSAISKFWFRHCDNVVYDHLHLWFFCSLVCWTDREL